MKTKEELIDKELTNVTGGADPCSGSGGGGYPSTPSTSPNPSNPTESYSIPIKGDDTEHVEIG